jgi:hypothetical protein
LPAAENAFEVDDATICPPSSRPQPAHEVSGSAGSTARPATGSGSGFDDFDDNIPF